MSIKSKYKGPQIEADVKDPQPKVDVYFTFYRWENWGWERLSTLPKLQNEHVTWSGSETRENTKAKSLRQPGTEILECILGMLACTRFEHSWLCYSVSWEPSSLLPHDKVIWRFPLLSEKVPLLFKRDPHSTIWKVSSTIQK